MKHDAHAEQSGFARLAAINPVPPSERGALVARLDEIKPELHELERRAGRPWWKPLIIALAGVLVLGVGGIAVAASWNPLSAIGSADRPAEPTDTLSPAVIVQLRRNEDTPPGWVSPIGSRLVDQARFLGELPDGHKVYAVPTSKGKLCILVAESAESCGDPLTRGRPITFTASKRGPGAPHVVWGATVDDVISVSFEVGGERVTVPVENNFYVWEDQAAARFGVSTATVTFADGTTAPAR